MTTTNTAYPVLIEQLGWSWGDWLEHCSDAYAESVLEAADPSTCQLSPRDLERLLQEHGFNVQQLEADAHPLLPLEHAGQALSWLGY
jgi:hypothetical protein